MKKHELKSGALWVGDTEQDFTIGAETMLPPLVKQDDIRYEYNQNSSLDCTLYGSIGAVSDHMNYQFTTAEIKEIVAMSYERWRRQWEGWWTRLGVECVVDRWNAHKDTKLIYYKLDMHSPQYIEAKEKWYSLVNTYQADWTYWLDIYDDAIVQWEEFGKTYWHCLRWYDIDEKMIDNYKGRKWKNNIKTNIYAVPTLRKLVENGVYYPVCYLILPEHTKDLKMMKRLQRERYRLIQNMNNNVRNKMTNQENPYYCEQLDQINATYKSRLEDIDLELKTL